MPNNFQMPDLMPAVPEIFLLTMACIILLAAKARRAREEKRASSEVKNWMRILQAAL